LTGRHAAGAGGSTVLDIARGIAARVRRAVSGTPPRLAAPRPGVAAHAGGRIDRLRLWLGACLAEDLEAGRGFLWLPVAAAIGIAGYFALPEEPLLAALLVAVAGLVLLARTLRGGLGYPLAVALVAVAIGATAAKLEVDRAAAPVLDRARTVAVEGFVEARERRERGRVRLRVRVAAMADVPAASVPRRIHVTAPATVAVGPGAAVAFRARLEPPRGPLLPGGYDPARAAFLAGIGATGFVYGHPRPADLGPAPAGLSVMAAIDGAREAMAARIRSALPGPTGEVAAALLVGERGGIPERIEEAMRVSGLAHVLSISGLHMVLVAGTVFWVVRALLALSPRLALTRPIKAWAAAVAALAATAYLIISGAEVATQRAYVTLVVTLVAVIVGRPAISLRTVAVAALVVLAIAPSAVLGAGFQMSFAAVVALVAVYEWVSGRRPAPAAANAGLAARLGRGLLIGLGAMVLTSLVAGLATAPIAAWHFHRGAPLSLLANLAAMPVVSILVMPPGVAALALMPFGLESLALWPMGLGIDAMLAIADTVTAWTGPASFVGVVPAAAVALLVGAMLWAAIAVAPWRRLALAPALAGLALLPFGRMPDVIVAPDGATVAVRGADGRLAVAGAGRNSRFVTEAWLAADGDGRAGDDPSLSAGLACDDLGCVLPLGADGASVAIARDGRALLEDCTRAAVVVAPVERPAGCDGPAVFVGPALRRTGGAVAIDWPAGGAPVVETALAPDPAGASGGRPWRPVTPSRDRADSPAR